MKFIKSIFAFFKGIFRQNSIPKMLDNPVQAVNVQDSSDFMNSIKVTVPKKEKRKKNVDTLTCVGDGLGIQPKIKF